MNNIYSAVLQGIASLINVIGTIYAVLSILKIKAEDIYKKITLDGMDNMDFDALKQREQARTGISLVILGWLLQVVFNFVDISCIHCFAICLLITFCASIICICFTHGMNNKFRKEYEEYASNKKDEQGTHGDNHKWNEF